MSNFVVQFPLVTEGYQEDILFKRFEIGRSIYNSLVNVSQKRYKEMIKTHKYKEIIKQLSGDKKANVLIYNELNLMRQAFGLTEYAFHSDVKKMQHHFKGNIDSFTAQKIATTLWKSYEKLFFSKGKYIHYKKYNSLVSLEGKSNATGIKFKDNTLLWNGLSIPVKINGNNPYEQQALLNKIAYCRIIKKYVRSRYKYYLQVVFKGVPPLKINYQTGEIKNPIGSGDVGLDIGTQTIAISSQSDVRIIELANRVQNIENIKRQLLRRADRSKRSMNPNNFNIDGTIKRGNKKLKWIKSNHAVKIQNELKELYRKQADVRKLQHEILANDILSMGHHIYVETMSFEGLQKRMKQTEINDKGKFKRKKRFGKSIANKAPAMLLSIVDRKLSYYGEKLNKIDTYSIKASQYNHIEKSYKKKILSQRWNDINGDKIQRDMYSAFLIMNVNNDLKTINQAKCNERFENFLTLHNSEVERLTGLNNLSSIAI